MSDTFTICTKCDHLHIEHDGSIWHMRYCYAVPREKYRDPYDGKTKLVEWPHCNNDGACKNFVPATIIKRVIRKVKGES